MQPGRELQSVVRSSLSSLPLFKKHVQQMNVTEISVSQLCSRRIRDCRRAPEFIFYTIRGNQTIDRVHLLLYR